MGRSVSKADTKGMRMGPLEAETAQTRAQLKLIEERRKWAVEQAVKTAFIAQYPEKLIELAKQIDNFVAGRVVS